MTHFGDGAAAGMRRAAEGAAGAGGERTAKLQGGALRPDPAAGQRGGRRLGPVGRRHLPSKPRVRGRTHSLSHNGDSQAMNMALDLAPDVFVMRVLLEETGEMFTVTDCHGDMTVQELKEELDLAAGIPLNLQLLQYLDQGGPFFPSPACYSLDPGAQAPLNLLALKGSSPMRTPRCHNTPYPLEPSGGKAIPGHTGFSQSQTDSH